MMSPIPKLLIGFGLVLIFAGILLALVGKIPYVGKLPGDIYVRKGNFTFYFPLATCLLISVLLTFLLGLFGRK